MELPALRYGRLLAHLDRMPMLKAVVPLAAGIALADVCELPAWFLAAAFLTTGAAAMLLRSSLCTVAMLLTAGLAAAQLRAGEATVPRNVATGWEIRIDDIPADRGRYFAANGTITAWRDPADGRWHAAADRVMVRTDSLTPPEAGERLLCRGVVRPLRGGSESYRRLMRRRGFVGSIFLSGSQLLDREAGPGNRLHIGAVRRLGRLDLTAEAGAVVRAMTAGDRSGITPGLREAYSRSGFSHLLAVSGLHTGIVFLLMNLATAWMPLLRRGHLLRNLVAAAAVWLFVAAAGFPPSAVRAAVMCTLLQFALAAAAFGMLLWNPAWLGDISFRLSFLAVGAILAWGVPLCRRLRTRWRMLNTVIDAYVIGLVATAATAPLVSHTFGILSLAGLLLNPAAILLATVVVLGGTLWMVLPVGVLAPLFTAVLGAAAGGVNALARLTAALPGGVVEYTLGGGATAAVYLFFAAATLAAWSVDAKKSVHLPNH